MNIVTYKFKTRPFNTANLKSKIVKMKNAYSFKEMIEDGAIYEVVDPNDHGNIANVMELKRCLEKDPKLNIITNRVVNGANECYFFVGNLFDDIPTLTEILNLPQGNEHWQTRVKMRKAYMEEQWKIDPNKVFWDYPDYIGGEPDREGTARHPLQTLTRNKISNKGAIISDHNQLIGSIRFDENKGRNSYIDVGVYIETEKGNVERKNVRRPRLVACTWIPLSDELYEAYKRDNEINIVPDHLDRNRQNDSLDNLEWVSKGINSKRMLIDDGVYKWYLVEIVKGSRAGEKFVGYGREEMFRYGITDPALVKANTNKITLGTKIRIIDKEEAKKYKRGFDDPSYFDIYKRMGFVGTNKPVQYYFTLLMGPYKGIEYMVTGPDLEGKIKRKKWKIQKVTDINMGAVWRHESVDKAITNVPDEVVEWIKENRFTLLNDCVMVKGIEKGTGNMKVGLVAVLEEDFVRRQQIKDFSNPNKRDKSYRGWYYERITLKEAIRLGFKY